MPAGPRPPSPEPSSTSTSTGCPSAMRPAHRSATSCAACCADSARTTPITTRAEPRLVPQPNAHAAPARGWLAAVGRGAGASAESGRKSWSGDEAVLAPGISERAAAGEVVPGGEGVPCVVSLRGVHSEHQRVGTAARGARRGDGRVERGTWRGDGRRGRVRRCRRRRWRGRALQGACASVRSRLTRAGLDGRRAVRR